MKKDGDTYLLGGDGFAVSTNPKLVWKRIRQVSGSILKLFLVLLVVLQIMGAFAPLAVTGYLAVKEQYLWRNLLVGYIAYQQAEAIQLGTFSPDYLDSDAFFAYGMATNSRWLTTNARLIVPYMAYEKVVSSNPVYPRGAVFVPFPANRSFHVGGTFSPISNSVGINERYLYDWRWNNEDDALAVLVHELVHAQTGIYIDGDVVSFENHTEAASVEILAGMCNHGNQVACKSFWNEISGKARSAAWVELRSRNMEWLYQRINDLFFRDERLERVARKSARHWAERPLELDAILQRYEAGVWNYYLVPGVVANKPMGTGFPILYPAGFIDGRRVNAFRELMMPFNDAQDLLGWLRYLMLNKI